jgi:ribosomal protein S18 acetylase RimI-like enzyme
VHIRAVTPEEYLRAGEVVVAAYRALGVAHLLDGYVEELAAVDRRANEAEVLVAIDDDRDGDSVGDGDRHREGRIVGCVTFVADPTSPWAEGLEDGEAGMRMLAVDPAAQRRGTGQLLLGACVERAVTMRRGGLLLHTTPWMTAAQRLYERNGFVRVEGRDRLPHPDVPLLAYLLDLVPGSP